MYAHTYVTEHTAEGRYGTICALQCMPDAGIVFARGASAIRLRMRKLWFSGIRVCNYDLFLKMLLMLWAKKKKKKYMSKYRKKINKLINRQSHSEGAINCTMSTVKNISAFVQIKGSLIIYVRQPRQYEELQYQVMKCGYFFSFTACANVLYPPIPHPHRCLYGTVWQQRAKTTL